jgi:surface protein
LILSTTAFSPQSRKELKPAVDACLKLSPKGDCSLETYGPIGEWDVSHVKDMHTIFYKAKPFNADISTWDVSRATGMQQMFAHARAFNADISKWDVSRVTDMSYMFSTATSFNADISKWDVSRVTNTNNMFYRAFKFNVDLSNWDVSRVTSMADMFRSAEALKQTFCGAAWVQSKAAQTSSVFACSPGSISSTACTTSTPFRIGSYAQITF